MPEGHIAETMDVSAWIPTAPRCHRHGPSFCMAYRKIRKNFKRRKDFLQIFIDWSLKKTKNEVLRWFISINFVLAEISYHGFLGLNNLIKYVEIKCQLDATDDFYCRTYCLLNMFREQPANRTHNPQLQTIPTTWKPQHQIPQAATTCIILSSSWWWA